MGSQCVERSGREEGVINNGQGAGVRAAGETRAVKVTFHYKVVGVGGRGTVQNVPNTFAFVFARARVMLAYLA